MMGVGGLILLIIVIFAGIAIFGGDSNPTPVVQPVAPVGPAVVPSV